MFWGWAVHPSPAPVSLTFSTFLVFLTFHLLNFLCRLPSPQLHLSPFPPLPSTFFLYLHPLLNLSCLPDPLLFSTFFHCCLPSSTLVVFLTLSSSQLSLLPPLSSTLVVFLTLSSSQLSFFVASPLLNFSCLPDPVLFSTFFLCCLPSPQL